MYLWNCNSVISNMCLLMHMCVVVSIICCHIFIACCACSDILCIDITCAIGTFCLLPVYLVITPTRLCICIALYMNFRNSQIIIRKVVTLFRSVILLRIFFKKLNIAFLLILILIPTLHLPLTFYSRLINNVIIRLLRKSANRLPIRGIIRYALTDGTYLSQSACILAMALGVAPIPKPHVPATSTAAS